MTSAGISRLTVSKILNHAEKRDALDAWVRWLAEITASEASVTVHVAG